MLNCGHGGIDIVTMISAIQKPQFATVMFNFDDTIGAENINPDYINLLNYLESEGVVPILIEYPYRTVFGDPQTAVFNGKVDLYNGALEDLAQSRGYPFIPFNQEMIARIPLNGAHDSADMAAWDGRFLSGDGVHFTGGSGTADPYANGGNPAEHATGEALTNDGYALQGWLIVQKMKEIKALVIDAGPRPQPPQNLQIAP
jgi:hypothetical protein